MTNTTISKEYIENIAKAIAVASPEELIELEQVLNIHPQGEQIREALITLTLSKLFGEIATFFNEEEEEEECSACSEISEIIEQQLTAQKVALDIFEQIKQSEQAGLRPFFVDYIKPVPVHFDLAAEIKNQVEVKRISDIIKTQTEAKSLSKLIEEQLESPSETAREYTLEEVLESIFEEIVEEIIEEGLIINEFILGTESIRLYEIVFSTMFDNKLSDMGLEDVISYEREYTAALMTLISDYLVEERDFELAYRVINDTVTTLLKA